MLMVIWYGVHVPVMVRSYTSKRSLCLFLACRTTFAEGRGRVYNNEVQRPNTRTYILPQSSAEQQLGKLLT
jgi:hypothetical protein